MLSYTSGQAISPALHIFSPCLTHASPNPTHLSRPRWILLCSRWPHSEPADLNTSAFTALTREACLTFWTVWNRAKSRSPGSRRSWVQPWPRHRSLLVKLPHCPAQASFSAVSAAPELPASPAPGDAARPSPSPPASPSTPSFSAASPAPLWAPLTLLYTLPSPLHTPSGQCHCITNTCMLHTHVSFLRQAPGLENTPQTRLPSHASSSLSDYSEPASSHMHLDLLTPRLQTWYGSPLTCVSLWALNQSPPLPEDCSPSFVMTIASGLLFLPIHHTPARDVFLN